MAGHDPSVVGGQACLPFGFEQVNQLGGSSHGTPPQGQALLGDAGYTGPGWSQGVRDGDKPVDDSGAGVLGIVDGWRNDLHRVPCLR